jgi:hypothetical protein
LNPVGRLKVLSTIMVWLRFCQVDERTQKPAIISA